MYLQFDSDYHDGPHAELAGQVACTLIALTGIEPDDDGTIEGACDEPVADAVLCLFEWITDPDSDRTSSTVLQVASLLRAIADHIDILCPDQDVQPAS